MTTDDFGAPLPTEAHTVEGMVFNPSDDQWKLRDTAGSLTVKWRRFDRWMAPSLVHSFRHVLLWYVENRALSTARNIHDRLTALLTAISASGSSAVKSITQAHLQSYAAIREKDYERLASVVDPKIAVTIINAADLLHDEIASLSELEKAGIDARTAGLAFSIWGRGAASKLEEQPYSLRLVLPWKQVDQRALRIGVHATDDRRLLALVEEAFSASSRRL